jgi:hypothetical protein
MPGLPHEFYDARPAKLARQAFNIELALTERFGQDISAQDRP